LYNGVKDVAQMVLKLTIELSLRQVLRTVLMDFPPKISERRGQGGKYPNPIL